MNDYVTTSWIAGLPAVLRIRLFGRASSPSGRSGQRAPGLSVIRRKGTVELTTSGQFTCPATRTLINSNDSDSITTFSECLHPTRQIFGYRCGCLCHTDRRVSRCGDRLGPGFEQRRRQGDGQDNDACPLHTYIVFDSSNC
jgi:hypothetical protein